MTRFFESNHKPIILYVEVLNDGNEKELFYINVKNSERINTVYLNTYVYVDKSFQFTIRLPISPRKVEISITKEGGKENFRLKNFDYKLLARDNSIFNYEAHKDFIDFSLWFSEYCGILSSEGSIYSSKSGNILIVYQGGFGGSTTPSRIGKENKVIGVSQNKFLNYTVPMCFGVLGHEYGHCYINNDPENESEADFNSLKMFLGLGFPKIEALNVWTEVFGSIPILPQNEEQRDINNKRYLRLKAFIKEYNHKF